MKKTSSLIIGIVLFLLPMFAQAQQKVTGIVVSAADKQPLTAATVSIKGTKSQTQTDAAGMFSIAAGNGQTLVISYVGFSTKEILISGSNIGNIELESTGSGDLGEVVIVGYGTQKKASVSGSVSIVDSKALLNRPINNTVQGLQGLAPGLVVTRSSGQPGAEGWNLNIRGISSLNGTNSPLLIVDGVEFTDLTLINPNDIAIISVLKDASAAAIYGAKAANGVVLVTTKKGSEGRVTVNYTGMYEVKSTLSLPHNLHSWEILTLQNLAQSNAGAAALWSDQQIKILKDSAGTFVPNDPYINKLYYYGDFDYVRMITKPTYASANHNINVSGGNDKTQYFIGLGYNNDNGMFRFGPDETKRYNARINLTTKFNNIFSLDSRLAYIQNKISLPAVGTTGDFGLLYNLMTIRPVYPVYVPGDNTKYYNSTPATTFANMQDGGYNNNTTNLLDAVFTLKAEHLVKGLVLSANYSPRLQQDNQNVFVRTIPTWSWVSTSQSFVQNAFLNPTNSIKEVRTTQKSVSTNALADYTYNLGNHHFHALGGFQYQYYNFNQVSASMTNLLNNNLPTLNYTSNATVAPTVVADNVQANAWVSYFGRLGYDYQNKYFIEATLRSDASSRLAPGHQRQSFPGVSAAWRISQEDWFAKNVKFVNELKLRVSWGKLGNAQLGPLYTNNYPSIAVLNSGNAYPFNNVANTYFFQSTLPSPSLGWETVTTSNIALDFGLLSNRLTGTFEYYKKINDNVAIVVPQPATLGVTPSTSNAAAIEVKGWDVNLAWKDRVGKVGYSVAVNVSDNINRVTRYDGNVVYSEGTNGALPGYSTNTILGYKILGFFADANDVSNSPQQFGTTNQGPGDFKYMDVDKNAVINGGVSTAANHGDLVNLGNTNPRYNYGINLGVDYSGFDLNLFFQGTGKRSILLSNLEVIPFIASYRNPLDNYRDNYWTPTHTDALFPRPLAGGGTNTKVNSFLTQNAAYIRLKNLQIGYTLPKQWLTKAKVQSMRIFFSGQDLWTKTKMTYKYFDPESPNGALYTYPYAATYSFGVNITL